MKRKINFTSFYLFALLIGVGVFFSYIHTQGLYSDYRSNRDYRRLQPDILPSIQVMKLLAIGHNTTYADILWIQLIQFIGDNIRDSRYLEFTHEILTRIHALHPRFARAYEIDLLFLPSSSVYDTEEMIEKKRQRVGVGVKYYETMLTKICNQDKINQIDKIPFGVELWEREDIKNPCLTGYIPYYLAGKYDTELGDRQNAARYYKIASLHDDAPRASRYLGIIAYSSDGNQKDGALTFALMATETYDEDPYICQKLALKIVTDISQGVDWSSSWIRDIENQEQKLVAPTSANNPQVIAGSTCYDNLQRSIKQIYLGYITQISSQYPEITSGKELLEFSILSHIPTIQSHSGFTVVKENNVWRYKFVDTTHSETTDTQDSPSKNPE